MPATVRKLPRPKKFSLAMIGPGVVLIAMGLGSGEFVLWPNLAAQFGLGLLWGALVGVTLQFIVSNEVGRYTLATGNSIFVGLTKLFKWFPLWFIFSTYISFAWPGIIGSGGQITADLLGVTDARPITVTMLIVIGLIFTFGGRVYNNIERIQKIFIALAIPLLFLIVLIVSDSGTAAAVGKGLLGIGDGFYFLPAGIGLMSFLGAVAYAGAGGNLILSHSFYVQDKGMGMAKHVDSQIEAGKTQTKLKETKIFQLTPKSIRHFKMWMLNTAKEQFLSFWLVGIVSIVLLAVIAYELVYPFPGEEGLGFILAQAQALESQFNQVLGILFMATGAVFLFTTQLGVFESTSRIMTENVQLAFKQAEKWSRSRMFFVLLWLQILFAMLITIADIAQPIQILFLNTFFSAVSMLVLSAAILWLNNSKLIPKEIQPSLLKKLGILVSVIFFTVFVTLTVINL